MGEVERKDWFAWQRDKLALLRAQVASGHRKLLLAARKAREHDRLLRAMVRVESAYVTGRLVEASDSTTNGNGEGATADPEAGSQRLAQAPRGPDAGANSLAGRNAGRK